MPPNDTLTEGASTLTLILPCSVCCRLFCASSLAVSIARCACVALPSAASTASVAAR